MYTEEGEIYLTLKDFGSGDIQRMVICAARFNIGSFTARLQPELVPCCPSIFASGTDASGRPLQFIRMVKLGTVIRYFSFHRIK